MVDVPVTGPRPTMPRWASLAGLAFVVLFAIGNVLLFAGVPSGDDPPAKLTKYFSDAGHRDRINLGWALAGLGLFFFLWFVAALRERVRAVDGGGFWTSLTTIGGAVYAAVAISAISLSAAIRTMSDDTYRHQVYPELIHAADDAGYVMHAAGGVGIAVMLLAASIALGRAEVLPRWMQWLGSLVAIGAIVSIFFFTILAWLLWLAVLSVFLFLRPAVWPRNTLP